MTKKLYCVKCAVLAACITAALPVASQDASKDTLDERLEEVLVTGGKDAIRRLPGSASLLSEQDILEFDDTDISDLLARTPGVYVRLEDGYGLRPNIGIRGAAAERSQKISLMEDGILIAPAPYSAPAAYYLPNVNRMAAVEVFKGPASIQYGPHTVGGALNFATAPVPENRFGEFSATQGSDRYQKYRAQVGTTFSQFGVALDVLHYGADGFKELDGGGDTGFERNDINAKFTWSSRPGAAFNQSLQLKFGYADEDSDETYLGLTDEDFALNPDRRYRASQLDRFVSEHTQVHAIHTIDLPWGIELTTRAYVNEFERSWDKFDGIIGGPSESVVLQRPDIFATEIGLLRGEIDSDMTGGQLVDVTNNDRRFTSQGIEVGGVADYSILGLLHTVQAGVRVHNDQVNRRHSQRGFNMVDGVLVFDGNEERPLKVLNEGETTAVSAYLTDEFTIKTATVTAGVRVENIDRRLTNELTGEVGDSDETVVLPGVGVFWPYTERLGFLLGVNRGFSPAAPAVGVTPDSELSTNFEYGIRYNYGALQAEVIGFFSDYSNLIGRCRVSDDACEVGEEFSAGDVQVAGAEVSALFEKEFGNGWRVPVQFVYTYTESAFQNSFLSGFSQWGNVDAGDELPYTPNHQGRLQVGLEKGAWSFNAAVRHTGEAREVAGQGALLPGFFTPAITTMDIGGSWRMNDRWIFQAALENVSDEREVVSRRPFGARPTAPQNMKVGFRYSFW